MAVSTKGLQCANHLQNTHSGWEMENVMFASCKLKAWKLRCYETWLETGDYSIVFTGLHMYKRCIRSSTSAHHRNAITEVHFCINTNLTLSLTLHPHKVFQHTNDMKPRCSHISDIQIIRYTRNIYNISNYLLYSVWNWTTFTYTTNKNSLAKQVNNINTYN